MDFMKRIESGYIQLGEMERLVADLRVMANKLGCTVSWRIKRRTATAFIKFNRHVLWKQEFTSTTPHMVVLLMYCGIEKELKRRTTENQEAIIRMRQMEEERQREREIANLPSWADRNKKK